MFACLTFFMSGIFNGGIGPVLGELSTLTNSTIAATGGVITFLFLGALIAQLTGGPIADKFGLKAVLVTAFVLYTIGLIGFTRASSLPMVFFFFLIAGLGQGCMNLGTNLIVANAYPEKSTSNLNLLHFFFGLGSFAGPALISLAISKNSPGILIHQLAAGVFFLISLVYLVFYQNNQPARTDEHHDNNPGKTNLYQSPLLWTLGVMMLVYVGVEYGMGSWATTLMSVAAGMPTQTGALVTSAYWGLFTIGRLSGAFLSRKLTIQKLLLICITSAIFFGILFNIYISSQTGLIISLVCIALCLGPIFPTTVALTTQSFSTNQGKAFGLVGAMSSIGGLSLPLIDGILLEQSLFRGYAMFNLGVLVCVAVCMLFAFKFSKKSHH